MSSISVAFLRAAERDRLVDPEVHQVDASDRFWSRFCAKNEQPKLQTFNPTVPSGTIGA